MNRAAASSFASAVIVLGIVAVASSQPGGPGSELPTFAPGASVAPSQSTPATDADREKIWNSPRMLRARAWVQEYCQRSARISSAEAQQYMTELQNLTPVQMKLWLLKFDAEEEMIQQQQAAFNHARQGDVNTALGFERQTNQAYANFNRDETAAAQSEQRSLNAEGQVANEREMQNAQNSANMQQALYTQPMYTGGYPPYGFAPFLGSGEFHVHYHIHR